MKIKKHSRGHWTYVLESKREINKKKKAKKTWQRLGGSRFKESIYKYIKKKNVSGNQNTEKRGERIDVAFVPIILGFRETPVPGRGKQRGEGKGQRRGLLCKESPKSRGPGMSERSSKGTKHVLSFCKKPTGT